jgi:ribosomal protein L11 methyltransferase
MELDIKAVIMDQIASSDRQWTQPDLERHLTHAHQIDSKKIRRAIRDLLLENRLAYTYALGCSFLAPSFARPVQIGGGVVLAPPGVSFEPSPDEVLVRIAPGAAFGMGDHPTTRLALELTAWAVRESGRLPAPETVRALDIGAGSGVLAIAAALMGVGRAIGLDTDPCARFEAAENIRLNGLTERVAIDPRDVGVIEGAFGLILANLRYPTLVRLAERIRDLSDPGAVLIFSGMRPDEAHDVLGTYDALGVRLLRQKTEKGWAGLALGRGAKTAGGVPGRPG